MLLLLRSKIVKKRPLEITIIGLSLLIPVILYWGVCIRDWVRGQGWYMFPGCLPWGIAISFVFIFLAQGVLRLNNLSRILTTIIAFLLILLWLGFCWGISEGIFTKIDKIFISYFIFLIVSLNISKIRKQFK